MPSLNTGNAILSNPIKVDSSYNVGIGGAASGSFKLQVTGTTNLTGALTGTSAVFSSTATATAFIPSGSSVPTNGMYLPSANTLGFATNSSIDMTITSAGNVGIATISPNNALLDVSAGGYESTQAVAINIGANIGVTGTRSTNTRKIGNITGQHYNNTDRISLLRYDSAVSDTSLKIGGTDELLGATSIEFATASSTTATPTVKLTIASTGAATLSATDSTGNRVNPFNTLTITTDNPNLPYGFFGGSILFRNRSYTSGVVDSSRIRSVIYDDGAPNNFGGGLWFETTPTPGGTLTPSLIVNYQGNVGIGTTTPTAIGGYKNITLSGVDGSFVDFRFNNSGYGRVFTNVDTALGMESLSTTLPLVFKTQNGSGSTERMRITSGGYVGIGVVPKTYFSTWKALQVSNLSLMGPGDGNGIIGANAYYDGNWKYTTSSKATLIELNQGPGDIRIYTTGSGTADNVITWTNGPYVANGGNSWTNGSSDIRKKKNFEPSQGLAELLQIEAIKYHFNWEDDNAVKRLGFKAQNLQSLIPEMVLETGEIAEDGSSYLTITPDYILPVLVKAIQELKAEIEQLKQK